MLNPQTADLVFFFLVVRRPPRPTPFPTRRSSDLAADLPEARRFAPHWRAQNQQRYRARAAGRENGQAARSEEHTSELQSQFHLVCRLLLEKKNPRSSDPITRPPSDPPRSQHRSVR